MDKVFSSKGYTRAATILILIGTLILSLTYGSTFTTVLASVAIFVYLSYVSISAFVNAIYELESTPGAEAAWKMDRDITKSITRLG